VLNPAAEPKWRSQKQMSRLFSLNSLVPNFHRGICGKGFIVALSLAAAMFAHSIPALASEPEDFQVIKRLVEEGATATAQSQASAYLQAYPQGANRDRVACWLGEILAWKGEAKEAIALLGQPLPGVPERERGALNLAKARALLDLKRPAEAALLLKKPGALSKDEMNAFRRLNARSYFDLDQPAEAAQSLKMIPENQRDAADDFFLGRCLALSGDDKGAREAYSAALGSNVNGLDASGQIKARLALAGCDYRLKDYQAAILAAEPVVGTAGSREAMLIQAWALHGSGDDAKAYDMARKAAPLSGWEDAAMIAPLREALLARDFSAASSAAAAFIKAKPDSPLAYEAHLGLARSMEDRGDAPGALSELESALPNLPSGQPKYATAMKAAELAWKELRDWDRAKRHFALAKEVAPDEAEKASALLEFARGAWEHGSSGDALSALAELVKDHPGTPPVPGAYLLLGQIRCAQGDRAQGAQAYQVVLDSFPDAPEFAPAALGLAEALFSEGKPDEASSAIGLTQGLPLDGGLSARRSGLFARIALEQGRPDVARAALLQDWQGCAPLANGDESRFLMGAAQVEAGDLGDASEFFSELQDSGLERAGRFRLARALYKAGKYEESMALVEGLAGGGGEEGRTALWALASWQAEAGKSDEAGATLQRLASLQADDPLVALAQRKIEVALLASEGPAAALRVIPAFLAAEPKSPERSADLLREARIRRAAGDVEGAAAAYREYLDRFPSGEAGGEAALGIADGAAKMGDWSKARQVLQAAPQSASRDMLLGEACFHLRDMPSAQAAFEGAIASKGQGPLSQEQLLEAHYKAGVAAVIQGKLDGARLHWATYAQSAKALPGNRDELFDVALWLQKQGDYEPALAALGKLRDAYRDAAVGFQYGYTLELMGRAEDALSAYLKVAYASSNAQWALTARYRAAELMVSLGRKDDAIALYRELVERTQGTVQGDYAKKRLDQLLGNPAVPPSSPPKEKKDAPAAPAD
jgi:tetratricopeptide (TPR) repeat protein